jgi:hypothetical protein
MIYALRFRNLMNFSRHQRQHLKQHMMQRATEFWAPGNEGSPCLGHWPLIVPSQGSKGEGRGACLKLTSQLVVNVLQDDPGYLHKGQDEGSKCQ